MPLFTRLLRRRGPCPGQREWGHSIPQVRRWGARLCEGAAGPPWPGRRGLGGEGCALWGLEGGGGPDTQRPQTQPAAEGPWSSALDLTLAGWGRRQPPRVLRVQSGEMAPGVPGWEGKRLLGGPTEAPHSPQLPALWLFKSPRPWTL